LCPFIRLPHTWEEYHATLNQKLRYNLRSRARRLQRDFEGNVHFRTATDADEASNALSALFALHAKSWGKRGIPSGFTDPLVVEFHHQVAHLFHQNGWLRLHSLYVGDEPIAAAYCFLYGDIAYFYQTAFDPKCAQYGPGAAILAYAIKHSIEEGAAEFDFLRGTEPYKLQWTDESRRDIRAHVASTARGRLLISGYRIRRRLRERLAERDLQRERPPAGTLGCLRLRSRRT
jgi:CelD/BcsL family acetyltransferase involved in cellulose biosynthesis